MQLCTRQAGHIAHKPLLLLCLQPWGAPLPMPLLPCTAGRHTEYPVYSIPNTGCRPANSSSWINLPHQNFMYRIFVTTNTKSWWSWKAEAALYGGILYVPRSRKEQVGGGCFLEQRLPSVRVWRLRLKAGAGGPLVQRASQGRLCRLLYVHACFTVEVKHELLLALLPLQIPVEEKAGTFAAGNYFIGLKCITAGYGHGGSGAQGFSFWPERQPTIAVYTQPQNDCN